ncbi:predicted protein [Naegleria gruberi]|uniref:Predicted protein n=1 Tax=Naegleria gruberi TaxID=5762 RepID=D2VN18_NAEGR|nr:uncharacterized protein NAEGRDRAFT_50903 [Naegleria gruberi]EFC41842.1 predicted protein [Naegleria gruberi]|eukprot:XP_002674586.1 predicted protein [Naegleria gruberi strain NEG-M]
MNTQLSNNNQSSSSEPHEISTHKQNDEANNIPVDVASGDPNSQSWVNLQQQFMGNPHYMPPNMTPQQYYYMTLWLMQQNGGKDDPNKKKTDNPSIIDPSGAAPNGEAENPLGIYPPQVYFPFPGNNPPNNSQIPSLNVVQSQEDTNISQEAATQEKKTKRRTKAASTTPKSSTKKRKNTKEATTPVEESSNTPDTPKKKKKKETTSSNAGSSSRGSRGGLRHFSFKVCELVQRKKTTTINDVADELVQAELQDEDSKSDDKNIRRRVYDALNVLMALNIISKDKKEIKWKGLPVDSQKECEALNQIKLQRLEMIQKKTQQLQELEKQHRSLSSLCQRNSSMNFAESKRIELPFIIVHTSKSTQIECEMDENRSEVFFNFDKPFEIHDDNEILYRLNLGSDQNQSSNQPSESNNMNISTSGQAEDDFFSLEQPTNTSSPKKPSNSTSNNEKDMDTQ